MATEKARAKKARAKKAAAKKAAAKRAEAEKAPALARRYSTFLYAEEYEPESFETWSLTLTGATVTTERRTWTPGEREDEGEGDEDLEDFDVATHAYAPSEPVRAETTLADGAAARAFFAAEVAKELPRRFDRGDLGGPCLWVAPPIPGEDDWRRWRRAERTLRAEEAPLPEEAARLLARVGGDGGDEARLVLADWLSSQADPSLRARGELAVVHQRILAGDRAPALLDRAAALLEGFADGWVSGLAPYARLGFRLGVLDTIDLAFSPAFAATSLGEELAALLALPSAAAVRRLAVGGCGPVQISGNPYVFLADHTAAIAAAPRPALRALALGGPADDGGSMSTDAGDLSTLWAVVPNLEELDLHDYVESLGDVRAPRLRRLAVHGPQGDDEVRSMAEAELPALEELDLALYGREEQLRMLAPLFAGERTPRLRSLCLAVRYSPASTTLARVLGTPLVARLEALAVDAVAGRSGYATGPGDDDAGFDELLPRLGELAHLRRLTIGGVTLSERRRAELLRALPNLELRPFVPRRG